MNTNAYAFQNFASANNQQIKAWYHYLIELINWGLNKVDDILQATVKRTFLEYFLSFKFKIGYVCLSKHWFR